MVLNKDTPVFLLGFAVGPGNLMWTGSMDLCFFGPQSPNYAFPTSCSQILVCVCLCLLDLTAPLPFLE